MGAIVMCALVTIIACVGGVYFIIQDKKTKHQDS
jgi:tRNA(Arg) A34 adenosine deaminase TadA